MLIAIRIVKIKNDNHPHFCVMQMSHIVIGLEKYGDVDGMNHMGIGWGWGELG